MYSRHIIVDSSPVTLIWNFLLSFAGFAVKNVIGFLSIYSLTWRRIIWIDFWRWIPIIHIKNGICQSLITYLPQLSILQYRWELPGIFSNHTHACHNFPLHESFLHGRPRHRYSAWRVCWLHVCIETRKLCYCKNNTTISIAENKLILWLWYFHQNTLKFDKGTENSEIILR